MKIKIHSADYWAVLFINDSIYTSSPTERVGERPIYKV